VDSGPSDNALPPEQPPADELRAAFRRYSEATDSAWKVRVSPLPPPRSRSASHPSTGHCVRIDLTSDDAIALAGILREAADLTAGPGRRGPNWAWIGSAEAAQRIGVKASTVRGWVATHGPRRWPFPKPDRREKGRNYWRPRTIDRWIAERHKQGNTDRM